MAEVTKFALADKDVPLRTGADTTVFHKMTIGSGDANNADSIDVFKLPAGARVVFAWINSSATLGASATLQLRANTTALTVPLTSAAGFAALSLVPPDAATTDTQVNLLVGGANLGATADVKVAVTFKGP